MKKVIFLCLLIAGSRLFAEKISFSAKKMSGQAGNSSTTTTLEGNATVKTESIEISAEALTLSGDDYRKINASGNVSGKNLETKMEFECETLEYDRVTKLIILKGNVKLVDTENAVNCGAQIIEYDQNKDIAIMQVQINLTQKDNVCSGSYAVYYKNQQLLEISGNAQVKQGDDTFRAQFITLDLDTQDINLSGNVAGTVTDTKTVQPEENEAESADETDVQTDADEAEESAESAVENEESVN